MAAQAAAKPHPVGNAEDLEAFFDGALRVQLESKHIAGAVVAVVVGDKLVFTKGYGYADVEKQLPVDPQTTMFRIASVTKLFTWTSAMQLVEEGKLDPDADINTYLKGTGVQIPAAFGKPITLKDLMTHTPGFEDRPVGLFAHRAAEMKPLAEVLKSDMPARVRPPGVVASYSNYGSALAGLAVATVAGKTWEDVVEERLLVPLGMKYTLARQPDALKLPATVSKAYKWSDGRFKEESFEYVPLSPAGAISASAADMSHFLIAHLNDGKYGDVRILKPETARRMRERLFAHDPKVDAMCYGFWELNRNGQRILHHGGDTLLFHTLFAMIPEQKVGLFLSYNTDRAGGAREEVLDAFLDRYFPGPPEPRSRTTTADVASLKRFEGEYSGSRHSETTYAKLVLLLQPFTVHANDNGTLTAGFSGEPRRYVPEGPLVFRELDGRRKLIFHEDEQGNISQVYMADVPAAAMIRETGVNQPRYHQGLAAACGLVFLSAFLVLARAGVRTSRHQIDSLPPLVPVRADFVLRLAVVGGCTGFHGRASVGAARAGTSGLRHAARAGVRAPGSAGVRRTGGHRALGFDRRMVPRLLAVFRPRALLAGRVCWARLRLVSVLLEFASIRRGLAHHQVLKERRESLGAGGELCPYGECPQRQLAEPSLRDLDEVLLGGDERGGILFDGPARQIVQVGSRIVVMVAKWAKGDVLQTCVGERPEKSVRVADAAESGHGRERVGRGLLPNCVD